MKRTQYQDEKLLSEIVGAVADATRRGLAAIANSDSLAEAATWWRGWGSFAYLSAEYVTDAASDWQAIAPKRYRMLLEAVETAVKGGPGSGFFGHTGRPGEVGGSAPSTYTVHSSGSALQWKNPDVNDGLLDDLLSNYDSNNVLDAVSSELANAWDIDAETIDWYLRHVNYADGVKKDLVTKKTDFVWSLLKDWTGSSGGPESTMVAIGAAEVAGLDFDLYEGTVKRQVEWVKKNAPEFGRALHRLGAIMYSKTQAWLTERKIDSLHVFRRGDRNANRLFSSWSLHPAFVRYSGSGQYVEETIPARSILSLPVTGFGTWSEREVVALPRDTAKQSSSIKAVQSPGYIYDRNAGRYRNATTGRYVSFEQVYRLLDSLGTGRLEVMERLTHEMHNGAISPAAWLLSMQHELVRAHLQASALGAGGWQQLTAQDYQRVDRSLRQELVRMEAFGRDIRAGRVFSEAQLRNRLGMYLGTARTHYFHAMRPPTPGPDEETLERRMLGDADHCSLCVYLAMLGWQPVGMLPVPGESVAWWEEDQCLSNCQCEMFRATMSKDEAERVRGEEPERALKAAELELVAAMVGKAWDESQHPRHAAGDERGGEFAPKEGGGAHTDIEISIHSSAQKLLKKYGIHEDTIKAMFDMRENYTKAIVHAISGVAGKLVINCVWSTSHDDTIGEASRVFLDNKTVHLQYFALERGYMGQGYGIKLQHQLFKTLANSGFEKAVLDADYVGTYAWAKEGFDYVDKDKASWAKDRLRSWLDNRGIKIDGELPNFKSAQDVASYKHPKGYTLKGSDIESMYVMPDTVMHIGKAFMLDAFGHGPWKGEISLAQFASSQKAVGGDAEMDSASREDSGEVCYADMSGKKSGSDAVFWAAYLTEDEAGTPLLTGANSAEKALVAAMVGTIEKGENEANE